MRLRKSGNSWVVHTPAKLNLFLEVLGKRSDGFHELETLMVTVNLFDTLVFTQEPSAEVSLRCFNAGTALRQDAAAGVDRERLKMDADDQMSVSMDVPEGRDNLAVRAAELLRSKTGTQQSIHIDLFKRIPAAAGLAGGSSDAAATLLALNQIWGLNLGREELQEIASEIGSDVSFFLSPSPTALCLGRGEILRPVASPFRLHFVIAKPVSGLSTARVFQHCRPEATPRHATSLIESLQRGDLFQAGRRLFNSLQRPAEELNPDVARLMAEFSRLPVSGYLMSGSGTACFGICEHRAQAMTAAARLRARGSYRVFTAESPP
jgi:4-diphosphocytidyl-2-C-methyl-D-erythritol kinase